jgi:hypothetical protein
MPALCFCSDPRESGFQWLVFLTSVLDVQVAVGEPFGSEDYMAPTPEWAVYGALEGGFDPQEVRVKKERRHGTSADSGGCT